MANTRKMKRSRNIRLVLLGFSAGAMAGCSPDKPAISPDAVYGNDDYLPGAGYYHAPFQNWYEFPYNYYDKSRRQYFYGGQWAATPMLNITNLSSPTVQAAAHAEGTRTDITRGGFGGMGGGYFIGG